MKALLKKACYGLELPLKHSNLLLLFFYLGFCMTWNCWINIRVWRGKQRTMKWRHCWKKPAMVWSCLWSIPICCSCSSILGFVWHEIAELIFEYGEESKEPWNEGIVEKSLLWFRAAFETFWCAVLVILSVYFCITWNYVFFMAWWKNKSLRLKRRAKNDQMMELLSEGLLHV